MDVAAWLRDLGLERYAEAFRAHDIDAAVLPSLTAEDLKDLGVTSVGHRRKILAAIAALTPPAAAPSEAPPAVASVTVAEAERRQLTLMFCDLVDSSALAAERDPEEMSAIIRAYQRCVAEVVERFDGYVAKYMGDGILVYFGYPRAHEDDAERAVRAGLGIVEAVGALRPRGELRLRVRIGIATGPVMVGEAIGEGMARERVVVGEAPNLAARLQELAEPDAVVIGPTARRLIGGTFDLADLGSHRLKGLAEPVPAWRVLGPSRVEGRFEARERTGLTPLVGRERELALLVDRWARAREGEGQVVLLVGEAGIGKSRLVQALRERLGDEPHTRLSHSGSPYHETSPLHPVIEQLERAAGFARDDAPEVKLGKLEALLGQAGGDVGEAAPLLAALLSIPSEGRYPPLHLTPQRQKELTLNVLMAQLVGLAARRPVLVVLEDAHWLDPTTRELFDLTVERVRDLPVLVLVTFRPDFRPPWVGRPHVTALALDRLSRRQGAALAAQLADRALPEPVLAEILARTDGVPLFVEELTKAVLESGLLHEEGGRGTAAGPLPPLAIPATLQDSLMARLDRLGPAKEVAQVGAAIGREFSYELLAAVLPLGEVKLRAALNQVVASGLLLRRGTPPEATYAFKHVLVQDAAYQSLLKSRRRQLHARIGHALEERFPDVAATRPELLAHHWRGAGETDRAADYLRRAAARAVQRSSHREAAAHLAAALELVQAERPSVGRRRTETALRLALGAALIASRGYAADEVRDAFAHARELSEQTEDPERLFLALRGLWNCHLLRTELREASALAEQIVELARRSGTAERTLVAHRVMATSLFQLGRIEEARRLFAAGLEVWDPTLSAEYTVTYGEDPGLFCCAYAAWCDDLVGFRDEALIKIRRALDHARGQPNRYGLAVALSYAALLHHLRREPERVASFAREAIELCREQSIVQWLAHGHVFRGWARAVGGHDADGLGELREGMAAWQGIRMQLMLPYFGTVVAQAHAAAGQVDAALRALDEADDLVARTGHEAFEAIRAHQRGELLLRVSAAGRVEAEREFLRCLELARTQGCRTIELRAATSLARLWRDQGRRPEARAVLAPICNGFTEGFDTPDLKDAAALLDELGGGGRRVPAAAWGRSVASRSSAS